MSTRPRGPIHTEVHILRGTYCLGPRRSDKEFWHREGVILPEGERDLVVGYLGVSRGFVGILCGFVISSIWELGGYSRGILHSGCGGTDLAGKWKSEKENKCAFDLCSGAEGLLRQCDLNQGCCFIFFFSCAFQSKTVTVWQTLCWRWSYLHVKKTDSRVKQAPTMDP